MAVPLVITAPASEFGDFTESPEFNDPFGSDRDMSYVPGFSEMRRNRDMAVARYVNHQIQRNEIPVLPVNLRWARNQNKAGDPDSTKPVGHSTLGYRAATKADVGQPWLSAMPPGATLGAGDVIVKGDTVLMVASGDDARKSAQRKADRTAKRVTGMKYTLAAQAEKDRTGWKGVSPTTTSEPLSPITVPVASATGKEN